MALGALCAAVAGFWLARELDSSAPQLASGTWLGIPRTVSDVQLTDGDGHPFNLQGKPSLVFFGYTHCPDVCPTTLVKLAQVKKTAGLAGMQVLFVTVDPQRDTPHVVGTYAHGFDPTFIGLTGDQAAIDKATKEFMVPAVRVDMPGGDYSMDHSALIFIVNSKAQILGFFSPPFDTQRLAKDLLAVAPYMGAKS